MVTGFITRWAEEKKYFPASFKDSGNLRIGRKPLTFPMAKLEALDIDDEEDFALAQALAANRQK